MPIVMDGERIHRTLLRFADEIAERNGGFKGVALIGIKRGGEIVAERLKKIIEGAEGVPVQCGGIDIGLYRDDLVSSFFLPEPPAENEKFSVTGKSVILCDDILFTGRSARAAIECIFAEWGRPKSIQLLVLVDRGGRELPIRADYVGKNVPTSKSEKIEVELKELGFCADRLILNKI